MRTINLRMVRFFSLLFVFYFFSAGSSRACTSVIISGKARADGRPVMFKHRDADALNNRMQWFKGEKYDFIGLVNAPSKGGEVWAGTNSAGFCIMNTATYDLKDDEVPASLMDKEGIVMFKALGVCATVADFEAFLDALPQPWGVEANFGVTDAQGNCHYFEVNNHKKTDYDVSKEPGGYMVVTNFTRTGRPEDRVGVDRFKKACSIFSGMDIATAGHKEIFNGVSRSGRPINREISASAVVFEGVKAGSDPLNTVMWTIVGFPSTCVYVPLKVFGEDHIPSYMQASPENEGRSSLCDKALVLKGIYGVDKGCVSECQDIERLIDRSFAPAMGERAFDRLMRRINRRYTKMYLRKLPDSDSKKNRIAF